MKRFQRYLDQKTEEHRSGIFIGMMTLAVTATSMFFSTTNIQEGLEHIQNIQSTSFRQEVHFDTPLCKSLCWTNQDLISWDIDATGAISQPLNDLEPGRHYIMTVWVAQNEILPYDDLTTVHVRIDGEEIDAITPKGVNMEYFEVHVVAPENGVPQLGLLAQGNLRSKGVRIKSLRLEPLGG